MTMQATYLEVSDAICTTQKNTRHEQFTAKVCFTKAIYSSSLV